jgi:hypothetical protein
MNALTRRIGRLEDQIGFGGKRRLGILLLVCKSGWGLALGQDACIDVLSESGLPTGRIGILNLSGGVPLPRVINVDGHPAYVSATTELKETGELGRRCRCRTAPYLNNIIEQDHRFIKKRIMASLGFRSAEGVCERSRVTRRCTQSAKGRSAE